MYAVIIINSEGDFTHMDVGSPMTEAMARQEIEEKKLNDCSNDYAIIDVGLLDEINELNKNKG